MKKLAPLLVLTAGVLWGCMGIYVRVMNAAGLFTMNIVFLRALVTSSMLGILFLIFDRSMLRIRLKDIWCFIGTGLLSIVFFNYCYFKAITVTSLSVACILMYTAPIIVMVLSFFLFKEKFTGRKVIALVMTFGGCVLVTGVLTDSGNVTPQGILLGLGAGFGYALYSIFSKFALERGYHSLTISFYTFLVAAVGSLFLCTPGEALRIAVANPKTGLVCFMLGVFGTVIPYLTYTLGLKYMDNGRASIIASIEPVAATLIGVFLYGERLTGSGLAGAVIVLAALAMCSKTE
ncbi:MAG: DMT family transporter [Lachnospiraceae bacterium]|nr:DMT family transporter [Lachnospiraceae bacterium]